MSEKKLPNGMKIIFAPGCFDNFEGTQEELDALVKELEDSVADGSFFENSNSIDIDDLGELTEEEYLAYCEATENAEKMYSGNRTLQ